jgi:uncharacterized Zn-finger protein
MENIHGGCPDTFYSSPRASDGERPTKHKCPSCNRSFSSSHTLRQHVERLHLRVDIACSVCNQVLTSKYDHRRHMTLVHSERSEVECPDCQRMFSSKYILKTHMASQHGKMDPDDQVLGNFSKN